MEPRVLEELLRSRPKQNAQLVHFFGEAGGYAWGDTDQLVTFEPRATSPQLAKLGTTRARAVEHAERYLEADTDESESDVEDLAHEVATICDKRMRAGVAQYKVRWKGYASDDDTWEPMQNLSGASAMVARFETELERQRRGAAGNRVVSVPPAEPRPAGDVRSQTAAVSITVTKSFIERGTVTGLFDLCELLGLSPQDLPQQVSFLCRENCYKQTIRCYSRDGGHEIRSCGWSDFVKGEAPCVGDTLRFIKRSRLKVAIEVIKQNHKQPAASKVLSGPLPQCIDSRAQSVGATTTITVTATLVEKRLIVSFGDLCQMLGLSPPDLPTMVTFVCGKDRYERRIFHEPVSGSYRSSGWGGFVV
jgi:hypothetical protein